MRLLSYNIWNYKGSWRRRRFLLRHLIDGLDPDIVALQEVRHSWHDFPGENQAQWLARQLGYHAYYRPANIYVPVPPVVEGLAFLSKMPCDRFTWYPVPGFPGAGPPRLILHGAWDDLDVFNLHFPLLEKPRITAAEILIRASNAGDGRRTVALGDFNARVGEEPMNRLFRRGFTDLWETLPPRVPWPQDDRIDYILGRSSTPWTGWISAVGTDSDHQGIFPSDHLGILAELE
jgi:endonuclease/exonuclease/phosphatase family metal-dependent hydrolase